MKNRLEFGLLLHKIGQILRQAGVEDRAQPVSIRVGVPLDGVNHAGLRQDDRVGGSCSSLTEFFEIKGLEQQVGEIRPP